MMTVAVTSSSSITYYSPYNQLGHTRPYRWQASLLRHRRSINIVMMMDSEWWWLINHLVILKHPSPYMAAIRVLHCHNSSIITASPHIDMISTVSGVGMIIVQLCIPSSTINHRFISFRIIHDMDMVNDMMFLHHWVHINLFISLYY
jgi:hypothetical protein